MLPEVSKLLKTIRRTMPRTVTVYKDDMYVCTFLGTDEQGCAKLQISNSIRADDDRPVLRLSRGDRVHLGHQINFSVSGDEDEALLVNRVVELLEDLGYTSQRAKRR